MTDNFDPCECIYNHESNMQRLLNMLRQSQTYCNDVMCQADPSSSLADQGDSSLTTPLLVMCAWAIAMAGVYAYRTFRSVQGVRKPDRSEVILAKQTTHVSFILTIFIIFRYYIKIKSVLYSAIWIVMGVTKFCSDGSRLNSTMFLHVAADGWTFFTFSGTAYLMFKESDLV